MPDMFITTEDLESMSELPRLLPGEVVCPKCNLAHRGECF